MTTTELIKLLSKHSDFTVKYVAAANGEYLIQHKHGNHLGWWLNKSNSDIFSWGCPFHLMAVTKIDDWCWQHFTSEVWGQFP